MEAVKSKPEVSMPDEIVWSDPPGRAKSLWADRLEPLMARPNEWARVGTYPGAGGAAAIAHDLKIRRITYTPGKWEFTSRRLPEGGSGVWARYLGPSNGQP